MDLIGQRIYANFILIKLFPILSFQRSVMNFLGVQIPLQYKKMHMVIHCDLYGTWQICYKHLEFTELGGPLGFQRLQVASTVELFLGNPPEGGHTQPQLIGTVDHSHVSSTGIKLLPLSCAVHPCLGNTESEEAFDDLSSQSLLFSSISYTLGGC